MGTSWVLSALSVLRSSDENEVESDAGHREVLQDNQLRSIVNQEMNHTMSSAIACTIDQGKEGFDSENGAATKMMALDSV